MPASDPKQLQILKALTTHLEALTVTVVRQRGRAADLDEEVSLVKRVFRGRTVFGAEEPTPYVVILENPRPDMLDNLVGDERLVRDVGWRILVQGFCDDDKRSPLDNLYRLKAVVEERLARIVKLNERGDGEYPEEHLLGGLISSLDLGPGAVLSANPQTGGTESFYLPIVVGYSIDLSDPFASS